MRVPLARRILLGVGAPLVATIVAVVVSGIILEITGGSAIDTYSTMLSNGTELETIVAALNRATPLFISAVAVAIGFRMNLFNIGTEGQYILASFAAASIATEFSLPKPLHIAAVLLIAIVVGALSAGVAGFLKVTRNINEVISTIMLNAIYLGGVIVAFRPLVIQRDAQANAGTKPLPESAWIPDLNGVVEFIGRPIKDASSLTGVLVIAIIVGVAYHFVVTRSRFGFDLRASGMNPLAAQAGGVPPKRMIMIAMLASGAVAGLIGMPEILSDTHAYNQAFVQGLGFAGIAVALLGRNNALGMAFSALLFGFLDSSSAALDVGDLASSSITRIMQATILIAAVVAYGVAERVRQREEIRMASNLVSGQTGEGALAGTELESEVAR